MSATDLTAFIIGMVTICCVTWIIVRGIHHACDDTQCLNEVIRILRINNNWYRRFQRVDTLRIIRAFVDSKDD